MIFDRGFPKGLDKLGAKVFGLIHFIYLAEALLMSICLLLVAKRFFSTRNKSTLVFTLFILCYPLLCFLFFGRGFFDPSSTESIMIYKYAMLVTVVAPAIFAFFLLHPLVQLQRLTKGAARTTALLVLLWCLTIVSGLMMLIGNPEHSYAFDSFDVYSTSFGPMPYIAILSIPISVALIDVLVIGVMYARERESFFRGRSLLLLIGWLLTILSQLTLLSVITLPLNPLLSAVGVLMMSVTILRKAPE